MAYASGQITGSANPAADLMTQIHTVITGHASWSYFTTEFTSGSYTARVYKNAAAGNPAGVDFYVAVFRLTATPASNVYIVAMEGWDGTNKYPIRFCPGPTTNFAPDATYFGHPNTTTVFGSAALNYNVSAPTNTTNFPYYIIVSTSGLFVTTGNTNAPYAGLFEPWWGSATSAEYPLVTVDYAFSSTYSSFSRVPTYTPAALPPPLRRGAPHGGRSTRRCSPGSVVGSRDARWVSATRSGRTHQP